MGATLNGGCDGPDTETRNCSVNIPCNGEVFKLLKHLTNFINAKVTYDFM